MTTGLTTAAMLAVMLLHAVFGCCWHHEQTPHAVSATAELSNPGDRHHDHGGCCGGHHSGDRPGQENRPTQQDGDPECCEGDCQFLTTSKVVLRSEKGGTLVTAATHPSAAIMTAQAGGSRFARSDGYSWDSGPALRRLTLLCVWRV